MPLQPQFLRSREERTADKPLECHQGHLSRQFLPFPFHAKSKVVRRAGGTFASRARFQPADGKRPGFMAFSSATPARSSCRRIGRPASISTIQSKSLRDMPSLSRNAPLDPLQLRFRFPEFHDECWACRHGPSSSLFELRAFIDDLD